MSEPNRGGPPQDLAGRLKRILAELEPFVTETIPSPPPVDERHLWVDRGIPEELLAATRASLDVELPKKPGNIFLYGGNGVGKSYAAAVLAKEWNGRWRDMSRIPMQVRSARSFSAEQSEDQIIESFGWNYVLVIDDLWSISAVPGGLEWILAALNERRRPGYATIVTAHVNLAEIDKVSGHIASRLGAFEKVRLSGKDRRLSK